MELAIQVLALAASVVGLVATILELVSKTQGMRSYKQRSRKR